jgi:DNA anti-recombination protein RmuC
MDDDRNSPATKGDLQDFAEQLRSEFHQTTEQLRSEFRETIEQVRSEFHQATEQLRSEFQHGFDDLKETIRDSQTEILKAFYGYIHTTELKLKDTDTLRERVSVIESRLLEVEKRLNLPRQ